MTTLARGLREIGCEVAVAVRELDEGKPMGRQFYEAAGFRIFPVPFSGFGLHLDGVKRLFRSIPPLVRACREFQPDLLHVHAPTLCLPGKLMSVVRNIPMVTTFNIQTTGLVKIRAARMANRLLSAPFGELSIVISSEMRRQLVEELKFPARRVRLTAYTIDESRFRPPLADERASARRQFGLPINANAVCMVARLEPRKNHVLLFQAIKILRERGLDVHAVCAGTGYYKEQERFQQQVDQMGIGDLIHLVGFRDPLEVYWSAEIAVLPSLQEGFPLTIIEAMHAGLIPVRTPSSGAFDQIIEGETGFIVPFDDASVLADRLTTIFENRDLRERMSHRARAVAQERFTKARMIADTLAVYREATAMRRGTVKATT